MRRSPRWPIRVGAFTPFCFTPKSFIPSGAWTSFEILRSASAPPGVTGPSRRLSRSRRSESEAKSVPGGLSVPSAAAWIPPWRPCLSTERSEPGSFASLWTTASFAWTSLPKFASVLSGFSCRYGSWMLPGSSSTVSTGSWIPSRSGRLSARPSSRSSRPRPQGWAGWTFWRKGPCIRTSSSRCQSSVSRR